MTIALHLLLAFSITQPGDSFPSGPAVGERLPDFKAHAFSGPNAGKEIKLHEQTKKGPTLVIFVHQLTRPAFQLLKPVDKYASEHDKLNTQIVWLSADKDKTEAYLTKAKDSLGLLSPITICLEGGKDGPETYGLNDKVTLTVLVAKEDKVVANFALVDPNAKDSAKVIAAIAKVLGKAPPKEEKKEETKKEGKEERSPELQKLMRRMIQKDNSEEMVKQIGEEMRKWAGTDEKRRTELRKYAEFIVRLQYGNEHCQAALKKLAE